MIIGAAKSGTSALFGYLCLHPNIFIPPIKETEFFSRESFYNRGLAWYKSLYVEATPDQVCGDASTTYTRWPHTLDAPELIANILPDTKFIYIMRHPVQRSYSHYGHHMREGVTMTFEEALEKDDIYVDCSMYMHQIERYLRFFPRNQFLFLFQDRLKNDPREVMFEIEDFLGIDKIDLTTEGTVKRNVGGQDYFIRSRTTMKLRRIPPIGYLAQMIPEKYRNWLYTALIKNSPIGKRIEAQYHLPPMLPETRKKLLERYDQPNKDLEKFLGVERPDWKK
jgi:hypothetical protein